MIEAISRLQVDTYSLQMLARPHPLLIQEGRVVMVGPVRQELLSGIKSQAQFERLRDHPRAFPDLALDETDYEAAAVAFNRCRQKGIQGSNTDFLLCAVALRRDLNIFTTDSDFDHYAKVLRFKRYRPRS